MNRQQLSYTVAEMFDRLPSSSVAGRGSLPEEVEVFDEDEEEFRVLTLGRLLLTLRLLALRSI